MAWLDFLPVVGDIIGGVMDLLGQNSANEANLQATHETNQMNYKIFQEQKAYQTGEREATQEYNTPLNQRLRYEQAGINPYMALGNISSGESTAQTSPAAPQMHVPTVQPLRYGDLFKDVSNDMLTMANYNSVSLDNDAKRIDLQYKTQEKLLSIDNQIADLENKRSQTEHTRQQIDNLKSERDMLLENLDILRASKDERKRQVKLESKRMELENDARQLSNDYQTWLNDFAKKRGDKEMQQLDASIKSALASANASNAAAAASLSQKVVNECQAKGIKIDNYQKNKINWIIREGLKLDNRSKKLNNRYPGYVGREFRGAINTILDGFSSASHGAPFGTGSYWNN